MYVCDLCNDCIGARLLENYERDFDWLIDFSKRRR